MSCASAKLSSDIRTKGSKLIASKKMLEPQVSLASISFAGASTPVFCKYSDLVVFCMAVLFPVFLNNEFRFNLMLDRLIFIQINSYSIKKAWRAMPTMLIHI
jgi:hypothetical protein